MPRTEIHFYTEDGKTAPALEWIGGLSERRAVAKLLGKLSRLGELGFELSKPEADILRDGIYELRVGFKGENYRLLYGYSGKNVAVISHGITKEDVVPPDEIDLAARCLEKYKADPEKHTFREDP